MELGHVELQSVPAPVALWFFDAINTAINLTIL
jgi:hypothetical protein